MAAVTPIERKAAFSPPRTDVAAIERAVRIAIDALKELGIREDCKVLVGGGGLSRQSALAAGADAYCREIPARPNAGRSLKGNR